MGAIQVAIPRLVRQTVNRHLGNVSTQTNLINGKGENTRF